MRALAVVLVLAVLAGPARADGLFAGEGLARPPVEWSTWVRGGYGVTPGGASVVARRVGLPITDGPAVVGTYELGAGIEASLPLTVAGDLRLGAWAEARQGDQGGAAFAGGELVITRVPRRLDWFLYEGHGVLALRAGRSTTAATAAIAWGYLAPYWLEGPCRVRFYGVATGVCEYRPPRNTRYMAGVRVVATVTRALDDPRAWAATLGLEVEPVGALRMLLVRRSWY